MEKLEAKVNKTMAKLKEEREKKGSNEAVVYLLENANVQIEGLIVSLNEYVKTLETLEKKYSAMDDKDGEKEVKKAVEKARNDIKKYEVSWATMKNEIAKLRSSSSSSIAVHLHQAMILF